MHNENVSRNDIFYGINYAIPESGHQIYYKVSFEDDIVLSPDGLGVVRNQILLDVKDGYSFDTISRNMASYGAVIVGYIEEVNEYQIEFINDISTEQLAVIIEVISQEEYVDICGFNYACLERPDFRTNAPWGESEERMSSIKWEAG